MAETSDSPPLEPRDASFLANVARGHDGADLGADWAAPRFEIVRRLGSGGFGTVYEAVDRERGTRVALKTASRRSDAELVRLKREFRALSELPHPNLVRLYELSGDAERFFFTMELVAGRRLSDHLSVRPADLRSVFRQLAGALHFLHGAGRVHRDVKPSNVMVDDAGRVVLIDLGLSLPRGDEEDPAGTPAYAAPEQMDPGEIEPAADWYALGVMLYEALARERPFIGSRAELKRRKREEPAPDLPPSAPEDLRQLCRDLLRRDPAERPAGEVVLSRLAAERAGELAVDPIAAFVGRTHELLRLRAAFELARAGATSVVLVHGAAGLGKSALVGQFLAGLHGSATVLAGRCFHQESIPNQTLDDLIDALGRYLKQSRVEWAPSGAAALVRVFPALGNVPSLRAAARAEISPADLLAVRPHAVLALRELLRQLGRDVPLVLFIDDLHWGDAEGARLLGEVLRPPDAPALLFVGSYRSDDADESECLRTLLPGLRAAGAELDLCDIAVSPLDDEEGCELARALIDDHERVSEIARDAGGSPFFIQALARHPGPTAAAPRSLEGMLASRLAALSGDTRTLLELVAVAGRPLSRALVANLSGLGDGEPAAVAELLRGSLLRARRGPRGNEIEAYHDWVRRAALTGVDEQVRRRHHLALGHALEAEGAEAEQLALHFGAGGDVPRATNHLLMAADGALEALGFERAARLYQRALLALEPGDARRIRVLERLGVAFGHSGRGRDAADAYLVAATAAEPAQARRLRRLAGEHLLVSGHIDEGMTTFRDAIEDPRLRPARFRWWALLQAIVLRVLLRTRGLSLRTRPEPASAEELERVDTAEMLAVSLGLIDPLRSAYHQAVWLRLALESGDTDRAVRALAVELLVVAARSGSERPTPAQLRLQETIDALLERLPRDDARSEATRALVTAMRGILLGFRGQAKAAREHLERGEARLSASPLHVGNAVSMTRVWLIIILLGLGEWKEMARQADRFLPDARARSDRFAEMQLTEHTAYALMLASDRPDDATEAVLAVEELWPDREDSMRKVISTWTLCEIQLYRDRGVGARARELLMAEWYTLARFAAMQLSSAVRLAHLFLFGQVHLAAAAEALPSTRTRWLRSAERAARKLDAMGKDAASAGARALSAGVAASRGERSRARALVAEAAALYEAIGMRIHAASCRWRQGELDPGSEGPALIAAAEEALRAQGVACPDRVVAWHLPGRW